MVCKFSGEDDPNYPLIRDAIIELAASPNGRSLHVTEAHVLLVTSHTLW